MSRRLTSSLYRGVRHAAPMNRPQNIRRCLATPAALDSLGSLVPKTDTTTLKNGLTIASEYHPWAETSTVGIWIDAGIRSEFDNPAGTAYMLEQLILRGSKSRPRPQLSSEVDKAGAHLLSKTDKELSVFYTKSLNSNVPKTLEIIADLIINPALSKESVDSVRDDILRRQSAGPQPVQNMLYDHLHATAFQGQTLGRTLVGPHSELAAIGASDLASFMESNFVTDKMVLAAAGGIKHAELVALAERLFSSLGSVKTSVPVTKPPADFIGSEVRIRDDTVPAAHIMIAVEGVGIDDPMYFPSLVARNIIGNWHHAWNSAPYLRSKLANFVHEHHLATRFSSFSTSYSNTGMWGIYLESDQVTRIDDLVHFTLREWTRLALNVTDAETESAKAQLKTSLLSLNGPEAIAHDIGSQIVAMGRRRSAQEVARLVDAVTSKDVKEFARQHIWDEDVAIAGFGSIEGLLDYARVRADTTRMFS